MRIVLTGLAIACAASLGGCGSVPDRSIARTGTVADVYVETAPGLFLERNLVRHQPGVTVAVVSLADKPGDDRSNTAAWVAPGTAVARGDVVLLRLSSEGARANDGVVAAGNRVVDVVAASNTPVAAILIDGL